MGARAFGVMMWVAGEWSLFIRAYQFSLTDELLFNRISYALFNEGSCNPRHSRSVRSNPYQILQIADRFTRECDWHSFGWIFLAGHL